MDVKQLRYFVSIAEEGSLSAAAARIGIAQPSLSQHVKNLEEQLGVDLLARSPRGVTLTQSGVLLLSHARRILNAVEQASEDVRASGGEPRGEVSFGLPSSVSMVLSVPLAETVRLELPQVRLRAIEAMSGFIQDWLVGGEIDLGILYNISTLRHMQIRPLLTEELFFFAAPDNWPFETGHEHPVRLADVAKLDLILPSKSHGLRAMIDRFARANGIEMEVAIEMDALTQIKTLVARASGYTILAPAAAQDLVERGELVAARIEQPVMRRPVYLVRNPDATITRASQEVERITLKVIEDLVSRSIWRGDADVEAVEL
ncbi:MAG: LysR family transcriptional regulator [Kiloniellales bacterium]|nr:LysR family transcriptional regulator [Kiloniellales bacterium]